MVSAALSRELRWVHTVLVIDDEPEMPDLLESLLRGGASSSYRFLRAETGGKGLRIAASELPDMVIIDLNLPDMSGREVCRRLREQEKVFYLPIMILTADDRIQRQIDCLKIGADDYQLKVPPFDLLKARLEGLLRGRRFRATAEGVIRMGGAALNMADNKVILGDKTIISLTAAEGKLLAILMSAEGKAVSKEILHKKLHGEWVQVGAPSLDAIKVHVNHIRGKLGISRDLIGCRKRSGYRFNVEYAVSLDGVFPRKPVLSTNGKTG